MYCVTELALLMVVTPVGWIGLIVAGTIAAAGVATVSMGADHQAKKLTTSDEWGYDALMRGVNSLL